MSRRALMLGLRNTIRTPGALRPTYATPWGTGWPTNMCELMIDGHPPARAAKAFLAIHPGGRSNDQQNSLDERYDIKVTLTYWINGPIDSAGLHLTDMDKGMYDLIDDLRAFVHMNYDVLNAANTIISSDATTHGLPTVYGFSEPLAYLSEDTPTVRGGEWLFADPAEQRSVMVTEMRFGRARRLQPNSNLA